MVVLDLNSLGSLNLECIFVSMPTMPQHRNTTWTRGAPGALPPGSPRVESRIEHWELSTYQDSAPTCHFLCFCFCARVMNSHLGSVVWTGQGSVVFTSGADRDRAGQLCGSMRAGQYGRAGSGQGSASGSWDKHTLHDGFARNRWLPLDLKESSASKKNSILAGTKQAKKLKNPDKPNNKTQNSLSLKITTETKVRC